MLVLHEVRVPQWPFGNVALFATQAKALGHLCDHVLTRPEAHYWARLIPTFLDHLDPTDDDVLFRFARSLWSPRPPWDAVQALYDGYAAGIVQAMSDALQHGWYWAEDEAGGPCWRGLGVSGVYVIWRENAVRTGMLLGYTAPPVDADGANPRRTNPLPRQHVWSYRGADLRHEQADFPPVAHDEVRALYHVFKKSAVRVRREYKQAWQTGKVTGGGRLGSLQAGVPDFASWQALWLRRPTLPPNRPAPFSSN